MGRWCHRLLVLLLSCSVLVTGLLPPAVLHAHTAGYASHDHNSAEREHHPHGRDHGHDDENGHSHQHSEVRESESDAVRRPDTSDGIRVAARHLHVTVLGLTLSVPTPEPAESSFPLNPLDDDDGCELVRLSGDSVTVSRVKPDTAIDVSFVWSVPVADSGDSLVANAFWRRAQRADRVCLGDSARFKRSGVLLI